MGMILALTRPDKPLPPLEDRERVLAKLDLLNIVEHVGIAGARELLPLLGMTEHFGLPAVTTWLNAMARDTRR